MSVVLYSKLLACRAMYFFTSGQYATNVENSFERFGFVWFYFTVYYRINCVLLSRSSVFFSAVKLEREQCWKML